MKLSSVSRVDFENRLQFASAPHSTVLPQTQAGLARWSGPRLCPIPTGAWTQMNPNNFERNSVTADEHEHEQRQEKSAADSMERSKIGAGTRAVQSALVESLVSVAAVDLAKQRLGRADHSFASVLCCRKTYSALNCEDKLRLSPVSAVIGMEQGEDCAQG